MRALVVAGVVLSVPSLACSGASAAAYETAARSEPADETGAAACGDGVIDLGEDCDGSDVGGARCTDLGPAYAEGELSCSVSCTFVPAACKLAATEPRVVINEVTSVSHDTIEIYNAGDSAVDLAGWTLSDAEFAHAPTRHDDRFVLPIGTVLDARMHLVLQVGDHGLALSGAGDFVVLLDRDLVVRDRVGFDADEAAESYCRVPDGPHGSWQHDCEPSFGARNRH